MSLSDDAARTYQPRLHPLTHTTQTKKRSEKRSQAAAARAKFASPEGDHHTLLAVYRAFEATPRKKQAEWASDHFVNVR